MLAVFTMCPGCETDAKISLESWGGGVKMSTVQGVDDNIGRDDLPRRYDNISPINKCTLSNMS